MDGQGLCLPASSLTLFLSLYYITYLKIYLLSTYYMHFSLCYSNGKKNTLRGLPFKVLFD